MCVRVGMVPMVWVGNFEQIPLFLIHRLFIPLMADSPGIFINFYTFFSFIFPLISTYVCRYHFRLNLNYIRIDAGPLVRIEKCNDDRLLSPIVSSRQEQNELLLMTPFSCDSFVTNGSLVYTRRCARPL